MTGAGRQLTCTHCYFAEALDEHDCRTSTCPCSCRRSSEPVTDDGIDVDHLLAEHRAATTELRRTRARNAELERTVDELRLRLIRLGDWRPL